MTDNPHTDWLEFWERRELPFISFAPYVLLVVATALDVAVRGGLTDSMLADLGISVLTAAWMLWMVTLHPTWTDRSTVKWIFFVGLIACNTTLVIRAPIYGFYTFTGYFWAFRVLCGRWVIPGGLAVAATSAISQSGGLPKGTAGSYALFGVIFLINAGVAGLVSWFGYVSSQQRERREQAISGLTDANNRLEESLRENAALQEQLLVQARAAGVSEERQRLAREIHDTLAQSLIGIITQLQAAEQDGVDGQVRRRHRDAAMELARSSLTEARRSVQALRPEALQNARLPDAIAEVAERWSALHDVEVSVTTTGAARVMRPEIEVALLRTAQEALANIAKHARAGRVGLTLSYMEDLVTLDVRDDGVGFDAGAASAGNGSRSNRANGGGGFGLSAMRERVHGVSGTLEIESERDGGTAISASVPALSARVSG